MDIVMVHVPEIWWIVQVAVWHLTDEVWQVVKL